MRNKQRLRRRFPGRTPAEVVKIRLYGRAKQFTKNLAARLGSTEADVLRAMIERLAIPMLVRDPEALTTHEKDAYMEY